jgi:8-oxo-dGTP diphosphatase
MNEAGIHFCPQCGTPTILELQFGKDRAKCPACGWIHFSDPKVAVAVLIEQDGCVLLTRRVNEPEHGKWTLPAGFVDAFEDPERAAERECQEETGLEVKVTGLYDIISGREHAHGSDIFIVYRAKILGGTLQAGDDADMACFFPRNQLPPLAFKTTRKILGS